MAIERGVAMLLFDLPALLPFKKCPLLTSWNCGRARNHISLELPEAIFAIICRESV